MRQQNFLLSIIIPVYNEEQNIYLLLKRLLPVASKYSYEIIFIDDGSSDNTFSQVKKQALKNKNIRLLSFTRNFGHQTALSAGYQSASGNCVVTIDADLQDPPELIDKLIEKWKHGFKIVYAQREEREDSLFKKTTASFFYRLINFLSDTPIPKDVGDFRLLDREVVNFLNKIPEKTRFLRGLVAWGGYSSTAVAFKRSKRLVGQTHYPLSKMINFALDGITAFSTKPLKIASYIGFFTSIFGAIGIIYALFRRIFLPHQYWITGWTALFVAVMFFGGIQLLTIGIIGEYIGKIYKEIQGRPQYLVKEKVNI